MLSLKNKVAVITGASRGIGRASAIMMAKLGAKVVVSSRKAEACEAVAEEIRRHGGEATVIPCHIGMDDQLQDLHHQTISTYGKVDILVCNAAVNPVYGPMQDVTYDSYRKVMDSNVWSALKLSNLFAADMAAHGGGSIIIVSSAVITYGSTSIGVYALSKAADSQLVRNLSAEWGPKNVRANCVAPGLIQTDMAKEIWSNDQKRQEVESGFPLRRLGKPEEIAAMVSFLGSDLASYVTGQTLFVDGGMSVAERV